MKAAVATAAIACIALTACGPFHRIGAAGPAAATSARVSSSARTAPPTPSPEPKPSSQIVYSTAPCQLPMGAITEASGAFVLYPSGAVAAAPGSKVALPGGQPGEIDVTAGITYDLAAKKWLPVPYYWLGPGGKVFIYEDSKQAKP